QPIEVEREQLVFEGSPQHVRWPTPQGSGSQGDVPCQLVIGVSCEDLADGLLAHLLPGCAKQHLIVRLVPLLAHQLEVGLGLAIQIAFEDLTGDLRRHDSASKVCWDVPDCLARSATSRVSSLDRSACSGEAKKAPKSPGLPLFPN